MATNLDEQLAIYLTDAHAIELQALEQVKRARKVAGDPEIAEAFAQHVRETERHEHYVADRLMALSWAPVPQKDLVGKITGVGMALFARFQPDTPDKLVAHAYSYERMEMALYDLLGRLAERGGDSDTAMTARMIHSEEQAMADRLAGLFDRAAEASLRDLSPDDLGKQLNRYLADAHATEQQAIQLLKRAPTLAGANGLAGAFEEHLEQTQRHSQLIEQRLQARDVGPSTLKDGALRLGALNLGMFFKARADTPAKLAAFAYAFEHLEVAAYELLKRVAARAQDEESVSMASATCSRSGPRPRRSRSSSTAHSPPRWRRPESRLEPERGWRWRAVLSSPGRSSSPDASLCWNDGRCRSRSPGRPPSAGHRDGGWW